MRAIALCIVSAFCLTLCTSCKDAGNFSSDLVGEWSGPGGRSMIFYPDGRVAMRDDKGVVPNCTYTYDDVSGVVKITRPEGASTLVGEAFSKDRLRFPGTRGKPMIFIRAKT
jgi:hypothetical protein